MCKRKLPFAILKAYFLKVMMVHEENGHKRSSTLEFLQLGESTFKIKTAAPTVGFFPITIFRMNKLLAAGITFLLFCISPFFLALMGCFFAVKI